MTISLKRVKFVLALLLTIFVAIGASKTAVAGDYTVVPGRSVGKIRLGASRNSVIGILGQPSKSAKWGTGQTQDTWLGPTPSRDQPDVVSLLPNSLNVIYQSNKVVQIEFSSPRFKTSSGISMRSSLAQFRARYKVTRVRAYGYDDPNGGGDVGYYYDAIGRGISFEVGAQDYFDSQVKPSTLRVHRMGVPVLPDPGGEPTKSNLETPAT